MENLHDYVLEKLQSAKGEWPKISEETGVPYDTLTKIVYGTIPNPGIKHVQALADYFFSQRAA